MAADSTIIRLGALDLKDRVASGEFKAVEVAEAFIQRIESREEIGAWAFFDAEFVRKQAAALDAYRGSGRPLGRLHGVPVGIKDIIDTAGIPTENGCAADSGRRPHADAAVVERLKAEGALILGKTVTTELAFMAPGRTVNPHNVEHTPGGSSSGSAAAVADGQAALAIGTQTAGSVIRPASFCGIAGFKPTWGAISRRGVLKQAPFLDTIGVFGAGPLDVALLGEALFGHDPADTATRPSPFPQLVETARAGPPVKPDLAFVRPAGWEDAHPDMRAAFEELAGALGDRVTEVTLPEVFGAADRMRKIIQFAELSKWYAGYDADRLAPETRAALDEGAAIGAREYIAALDWREGLNRHLAEVFAGYDAILCPAAPGPAPKGLSSTGDAIFNGLWTLAGTPAVTLPILTAGNGLPMGVQLVGPPGGDGRLLRTARWLYDWADTEGDTE